MSNRHGTACCWPHEIRVRSQTDPEERLQKRAQLSERFRIERKRLEQLVESLLARQD
jgi:hypothetical protein